MGLRDFFITIFILGTVQAQTYRVCISSTSTVLCQSLDRDGSQAVCEPVESKIDCAVKLSRGDADIGVFSEEEMVLLGQHQPNINRVIASIRDVTRNEPFAFEAVAVVSATHTGGLEGLRGGQYCHPGFDQSDLRWSPRVLKTFEQAAARSDRCPEANTDMKTAEEMEVEVLSQFFTGACRPGPWSANASIDADLRSRYSSLCSLCGNDANCSRYTIDMGISVSGVNNNNRHIQSLECLRSNTANSNNSNRTVAYVAWQHVREFFTLRNPQDATSYALLCEDGSIRVLTTEVLASSSAPCSFVKQPWSGIVTTELKAAEITNNLRQWWPNGANPGGNTWQTSLFNGIIGGANARVNFLDAFVTPQNYTLGVRNFTTIEASTSCMPARRWCTISTEEQTKCSWIRSSAHTLGIQPAISCQQRNSIFECLADIRDNNADFIASAANYGYIARQHYKLTAVKLIQNSRSNPAAFSRVAALLLDTTAQSEITRFENLRGTRACFPEFGGISYVAFVQTAHERSIINANECDYMKAVGEFFDGACAPGALDVSHAIAESTYNATNLCSVCAPSVNVAGENFTCAFDYTNLYYGNNGTIRCLADPTTHIAFVELHNIEANLQAAGLQASQVRALCRNNTLAANTGVSNIDQNCLLAFVVDSEVLTRRNDPLSNSVNALLDTLDLHFGYNAATTAQLINLEMYSPFDGISDLLFKNTAVGLSEPSSDSANEAARNYNDLFKHLESCNGSSAMPGMGNRNFLSFVTLLVTIFITRFVLY